MRVALGFIVGVSAVALGCASVQESRMYKGPFGRTQIATTVLAADPVSGKILVQTSDGMLRVFRVNAAAGRSLGSYRVGDDLLLTFDDRTSGDAVVAIEGLQVSADNMPFGASGRYALPSQLRVGAPLVYGSGSVAVAGDATGATRMGNGVPLDGVATGGAVAPGFSSLANFQTGALTPQQASTLGLASSNGTTLAAGNGAATAGNLTPGTIAPGVTTATQQGKPSIQGPFTPGTVAPGVTATNAQGKPSIQGPFTPGTVAPGVSASLGNAAPGSTSTSGSSGSSGGMTIRTPGAAPPVPDAVATSAQGAPAGGGTAAGASGTGGQAAGNDPTGATGANGAGTAANAGQPSGTRGRDSGPTSTTPRGAQTGTGRATTPAGNTGGRAGAPGGAPAGGAPVGSGAPAGGAPAAAGPSGGHR